MGIIEYNNVVEEVMKIRKDIMGRKEVQYRVTA